jgi:hypothetical protein
VTFGSKRPASTPRKQKEMEAPRRFPARTRAGT